MKKKILTIAIIALIILTTAFAALHFCFIRETPMIDTKDMTEKDIMMKIIQTYRSTDGSENKTVNALVDALKKKDPEKGKAWENLMKYWVSVNTEMTVNEKICDDGLPNDESLCIVVLGYQLNPDGTMTKELEGRLETALNCAHKYTAARVAVTGGGTASGNSEATEADEMAKWLVDKGIDSKRIIIENNSLTTSQNALFTADKFKTEAPEVKELVIVTSDYHIMRGCMVFATRMILGGDDIKVVSNAAYVTGRDYSNTVSIQASEVSSVASVFFK